MTADASNSTDAERVISMASHVKSCGGKAVCILQKAWMPHFIASISDSITHSHQAYIVTKAPLPDLRDFVYLFRGIYKWFFAST